MMIQAERDIVKTINRIEKLTAVLRHQSDQYDNQFAAGLAARIFEDCDRTVRNIGRLR